MLVPTLLLLLPAYGSGLSNPTLAARPVFGDRDTLPLVASESLFFLGIEGDFKGNAIEDMEAYLSGEMGLKLVGKPVRGLANRERVVFGVRSGEASAEKVVRPLTRPLKKLGYKVEDLRLTALSLIGSNSVSGLQRSLRGVERADSDLWAFSMDAKENLIWGFHGSKFKAEELLEEVRDSGLKASFHHQEFEFGAGEGADLAALTGLAGEKLDLVRATERDNVLVLDLYLRELDRFLALDRKQATMACPDIVSPFLQKVPAGKLNWQVTLENRGYPFVD
ncbi:MAG TPA: hypothetical protein VGC54_11385 [Planctomycetota bacterium]